MPSKKLLSTLIISLVFIAACMPTGSGPATPSGTKSLPTNATGALETKSPVPATVAPAETKSQATETTNLTPTLNQPTQVASPSTPAVTVDPQPQSNCSDSASFVADVTIPDHASIAQGKAFVKTWRIRNSGTCSWNEKYSMVFANGNQMNSPASLPFKATAPGATLDLSVDLVAPSVDAAYTGNYELHNAAGQLFMIDNTRFIWVKIDVGTGSTSKQNPVSGVTAASTPVTASSGTCTYSENAALQNDILNLINVARATNGLPALSLNSKLSAAAMGHAIDMACHSTLSHIGSDGSSITDRFNSQGYSYSFWNEAIYAQPPQYGGNAQSAVDWWLNDPTHRPILLSSVATDIGTGYALVTSSTLGGYFTVDVGAP
jgi:uncharacterized protein YkwD